MAIISRDVIQCDILKTSFERAIVIHQVNNLGIMGGGLAKQIAEKYPQLFEHYNGVCHEHGSSTLGTCNLYHMSEDNQPKISIANLFSQEGMSHTSYDNLILSLQSFISNVEELRIDNIKADESHQRDIRNQHYHILYPYMMGCGIADGNFKIVQEIIEQEISKLDNVTLVCCKFIPQSEH